MEFFEKCPECGGEFEAMTGVVYDIFPASYPVKCKQCGYEGYSAGLKEALAAGWKRTDENQD